MKKGKHECDKIDAALCAYLFLSDEKHDDALFWHETVVASHVHLRMFTCKQ